VSKCFNYVACGIDPDTHGVDVEGANALWETHKTQHRNEPMKNEKRKTNLSWCMLQLSFLLLVWVRTNVAQVNEVDVEVDGANALWETHTKNTMQNEQRANEKRKNERRMHMHA
jgi:hypothetical protein